MFTNNKNVKEENLQLRNDLDNAYSEIERLKDIEVEIRRSYERKEQHASALMEVELEKKLESKTREIKDNYAKKEAELLDKNFEKLSSSLEDLHSKGNANTKYIEKASLKMMDMMAKAMGSKAIEAPRDENDEDKVR